MKVTVQTERIDELLAAYDRTDQPGLAVGIALRGEPRYRRAFGLANVELPAPLAPDMRMRVASVTKHFCSLAVMLLVEEGKVAPDASIRNYLPELPQWAESRTVRQLMNHTSGMRCSGELLIYLNGGPGQPVRSRFPFELMLGLRSVNFEPCTDFAYCNSGYLLLSELVDRVSGIPFEQFLRERVLLPVGMQDSQMRARDSECLANSATLHVPDGQGGFRKGGHGRAIRGEGGLVSTIDDMLRWLAHLSRPVVGTAQTWSAMRTPATLATGWHTHYALGLMTRPYRGLDVIHHSGGTIGGTSQMIKVLGPDLDVMVIANSSAIDSVAVAECIIDACIEGLPPGPAVGEWPVTGDFYDPESGRFMRLLNEGGRAHLEVTGNRLQAVRADNGSFWARTHAASGSTLSLAANGSQLTVIEPSGTRVLARIAAPSTDEACEVLGDYVCSEAACEAQLHHRDGRAVLSCRGSAGGTEYRLEALGPGLWYARDDAAVPGMPWPLIERHGRDLLLSTTRTRRLEFRRC